MQIPQLVQYYLKDTCSVNIATSKLLVAVSGGVDSIVLVDILHKLSIDFAIMHCNFQLRGAESDRDETFVINLALKYNKQVYVKHFNTNAFAKENAVSIQVAARTLRYNWFQELLSASQKEQQQSKKHRQSCFIATAHHANDNVETVMHHFFRGTGIAGLHGILPIQNNIIRPLLAIKKREIIDYATKNELTWVEDSSNELNKYTRNAIRHDVIPVVETVFPNAIDNVLNNIERWKEVELIYEQAVDKILSKLLVVKGNEIHVPIVKLQKTKPLQTVVFELIKNYGFSSTQVTEVIKLLDGMNGSMMVSTSHRLIVNRGWLIVAPIENTLAATIVIEELENTVEFREGFLQMKLTNNSDVLTSDNSVAFINVGLIQMPLVLRPYKTGDYFYPLGLNKKKKLSKFLMDKKLSVTEKEKIWVLESDKKIIWVIGHRIDHRCRITPQTQQVLQIKFQPKK
ncbi:MAG: tRNA lysidine(34) synthetase TilS [Chitinophagaceae bacterium]